jgi:hypothetical protein
MTNNQQATADHYIPLSKGGKDTLANIIMACARCNRNRSNSPAEAFWEAVQGGRNIFINDSVVRSVSKLVCDEQENTSQSTLFYLSKNETRV